MREDEDGDSSAAHPVRLTAEVAVTEWMSRQYKTHDERGLCPHLPLEYSQESGNGNAGNEG